MGEQGQKNDSKRDKNDVYECVIVNWHLNAVQT